MAEQAAGAVASAVIGGITDRALTTVMRKLRSGSRPAAAHEKLQRLETLLLKLRSVIQVSEKHAIESTSLLEWRDRLREAAAVVLDFQRRAREEENGDAASTSAPRQQQPAGGGGGAGAASGPLYFTRSALGGMAQRVRDATRRLFSADEDMKKLHGALEKMERLSPDISQFLLTLHLEVSPEPKRRRSGMRATPASIAAGRKQQNRESKGGYQPDVVLSVKRPRFQLSIGTSLPSPSLCSVERVTLWDSDQRPEKAVTSSETTQLAAAADEARDDQEWEARMLARELELTLQRTEIYYVKKTDDRDMGGLEWLAEWASVIGEAMERGNAVLQTLRPGSDVIHNKAGGAALEEDGELYCFVRVVQRLALEAPGFAV